MAGTALIPSAQLEAAAYEEHRRYVLAVLARRCRWLPEDERESTLHEAWAVMLHKERAGTLDVRAMSTHQIRAYLTQTALNKALDEGRRSRHRDEPLGDRDDFEATTAGPDELADAQLEGTRVREILGELSARQQTIVKLRFFFDRSPEDIQRLLSLTERVYRRELERALAVVSERYELVREGRFCESRASVVRAYVAGIAGPNRARDAREHLAGCPACRRMALELRRAAGQVAAVLPMPPVLHARDELTPIVDLIMSLRDVAGRLVGSIRNQLAGLPTRVDPSASLTLAGARPGAVAATLGACIAVGGGATYCVVDSVPKPVRDLVGKHHRATPRETARSTPRTRTAAQPAARAAVPAATVTSAPARAVAATPKAKAKAKPASARKRAASTARTRAAAASRAATQEFGLEGTGTQMPGTPAGTTAKATTATAAPSTSSSTSGASSSAEFGP
jgi:RNA polymerase sigma factor (sigma-70 family)